MSILYFFVGLVFSVSCLAQKNQSTKQVTTVNRTNNYGLPMYFEAQENILALPPAELEYDLTEDEGQVLHIGPVTMDKKNFGVHYKNFSSLSQILEKSRGRQVGNQKYLIFLWPEGLLKQPSIELISREGKTLWKHDVTAAKKENWDKQVKQWSQNLNLKNITDDEKKDNPLLFSQYGLATDQLEGFRIEGLQSFRFCLTQKSGKYRSKICTKRQGTKGVGANLVMGNLKSQNQARVLLQNQDAPLKQSVPVEFQFPTSFYADLASGESYEFVVQPKKINIMDISEVSNTQLFQIIGTDLPPFSSYEIINKEKVSKLTEFLGFQSTIKDNRVFWLTQVSREDSAIYFSTEAGGIFKQKIDLQKIPKSQFRPYLANQTLPGTYVDGAIVKGKKDSKVQISTTQNSVDTEKKDLTSFTWHFGASEKGKINRSYLDIQAGEEKYRAYYELYRGYANELSARLSGIVTSSQTVTVGELAFNHWFETIFGSENLTYSKQRWGLSAKYFKSLNQMSISSTVSANLDVTAIDMKYRLTPGLWTRDESVGLMASYQSVAFGTLNSPMAGVGAFWARSMPQSIDNLFNYFSFMRYPKWVDMEFIYYATSMKSSVTINPNYALNFHGQVLWKENFFGEAGFGMRKYSFADNSIGQKAELNTFFGTLGMGLKF